MKIVLLVVLLTSFNLFASEKINSKEVSLEQRISQAVAQYKEFLGEDKEVCAVPEPTMCIQYVCNTLGSFQCDTNQELLEVTKACYGNYGYDCIKAGCSKVNGFDCMNRQKLLNLTVACKGNPNGNCVNYVCNQLGAFGCDTLEEIYPIAKACGSGQ